MIVASIDIGTNTVLLLIAKLENQVLTPLLNDYRIPRLGRNLQPGSNISSENIDELFSILNEFKKVIDYYNCDEVIVTGTHALRIASNSLFIKEEIVKRYNYQLDIIDGETEAKYAFFGAVAGYSSIENNLAVIDIGGGSTELIFGNKQSITFNKSFPIGSVSGTENYLYNSPPLIENVKMFQVKLDSIFSETGNDVYNYDKAIAISGTGTTIACMCFGLKDFSENIIENQVLEFMILNKLVVRLSSYTTTQILSEFGNVVKGREDIILAGALILLELMKILKIKNLSISSRGIRHGAILYKYRSK